MEWIQWIKDNWPLVVMAVLVLDKVVAATPCKWDDLILTAIKGVLSKTVGRAFMLMLPVLIVLPLMTGCAMKNLSPPDKAVAVGQELTNAYEAARAEHLHLVESLPPDKALWMKRNVAPVLNEAQDYLVLYRRAANTWRRTQLKPDEIDGYSDEVTKLIKVVWDKIAQVTGMEV